MAHVICPTCGYDLRAQITKWGARCPECGGDFPAEALAPSGFWRAWVRPGIPNWPWVLAAIGFPPLVFIVMVIIGFLEWYEPHLWPLWYRLLHFAVLPATAGSHVFLVYRSAGRRHAARPWRAAVIIGPALSVAAAMIGYLAFVPVATLTYMLLLLLVR